MSCKCVRLNRWPVRGEWWPGSDPRKWRSFTRWGNGPHLHYLHHPDNQLEVYLYQYYLQHMHSPYYSYNHWQSSSLLTVWEKHPNSKLKGLAVGQWEFWVNQTWTVVLRWSIVCCQEEDRVCVRKKTNLARRPQRRPQSTKNGSKDVGIHTRNATNKMQYWYKCITNTWSARTNFLKIWPKIL